MTVPGPPPVTTTFDPCLLYISETSTSALAASSVPPNSALASHTSMNSITRTIAPTTSDTSTSVLMYSRHAASSSSYTTRLVASNSDYTVASYVSPTKTVSVTLSSTLSSSVVDLMSSSVPVKDRVSSSHPGHSTLTSMLLPSGKILNHVCM